jgi:hypothetical protein
MELEEPISETLKRDAMSVALKFKYVLSMRMKEENAEDLRDWDLWGPLFLTLALSLSLSVFGDTDGSMVFSVTFFLIAAGAVIVTLNTVLLGGSISFFHSVCVLGYCLLPMTLAGIGVCLLGFLWWPLRAIIVGAGVAWASFCASGFMSAVVEDTKKRLAAYPVFLFYVFLGWLILLI